MLSLQTILIKLLSFNLVLKSKMAWGSFYHADFYYFLCVTQAISEGLGEAGGRQNSHGQS
jgi:hypothetical protein